IGSIVGVGLMNSYLSPDSAFGEGVNWAKVSDTAKALLFSPIIGFVFAALLLWLARRLLTNNTLFQAPQGDTPPPWPVRLLLVLTCTGVSFAHGSNDGQKGQGLIMLILIGVAPVAFALNLNARPDVVQHIAADARSLHDTLAGGAGSAMDTETAHKTLTQFLKKKDDFNAAHVAALAQVNSSIVDALHDTADLSGVPPERRRDLRMNLYLVSEVLVRLDKAGKLPAGVDKALVSGYQKNLKNVTTFIPVWVKVAVAIALGFGTMIGWKRIVVTVGEKIGKAHLTYAQGASAELVAMATIEAADQLGLPVSTTHVLSSGIAGTMVASGSGVQKDTVRNVMLAWVLTLPVCVLLGASTFAAGLFVVFRLFGVH
ncbi:MAG: inorganic phosphate transporter, partial [Nevskia sp.]|nr:inorganic phosphate transporter [Nevskia sp.]